MRTILVLILIVSGVALAGDARHEYPATRTERDAMRTLVRRLDELEQEKKALQETYRAYVLDKAASLGIAGNSTQTLAYDFKAEVFYVGS